MLNQVQSSNIEAIGHDPLSSQLVVRFKSGKTYVFKGVPSSLYDEFVNAQSKGKYFGSHVRDNYQFEEITGQDLSNYLSGATGIKRTPRIQREPLTFEQILRSFGGQCAVFF